MPSNINKKIQELFQKEMSKFFDHCAVKDTEGVGYTVEEQNAELSEFFEWNKTKSSSSGKVIKEKSPSKPKKVLEEHERCVELKKDGSHCSNPKSKKDEIIGTEFENMCSIHVNAAIKKAGVSIETLTEDLASVEVGVIETTPTKTKSKSKSKKTVEQVEEDEIDPPFEVASEPEPEAEPKTKTKSKSKSKSKITESDEL